MGVGHHCEVHQLGGVQAMIVQFSEAVTKGDEYHVTAIVDNGMRTLHAITTPHVRAWADRLGVDYDDAIDAILESRYPVGTVFLPLPQEHRVEMKEGADDVEVHQSMDSPTRRPGGSDTGTGSGAGRRNFLGRVANSLGVVRPSRRRRVVARKQAGHGGLDQPDQ